MGNRIKKRFAWEKVKKVRKKNDKRDKCDEMPCGMGKKGEKLIRNEELGMRNEELFR